MLNVGNGESKKGRISHYIAVPGSYNVGDVGPAIECNIISQDHSRPIHEHEMIVSEDILRPTPLTNIQRGKRYGCKVVNIHDPNRIVAQVSYRLSHMAYHISWFLKGYLTFIFFVKGST